MHIDLNRSAGASSGAVAEPASVEAVVDGSSRSTVPVPGVRAGAGAPVALR